MGRYAHFTTGFEYKFMFGSQDSEDIRKFYGTMLDIEIHEWTADDIPKIKEKLGTLCSLISIDTYDKSVEGTYKLKNDISRFIYPAFVLGCLIYHQLLYTPVLKAEYEL